MKDVTRYYPLLTEDERFRLFVEAMGRKDEQELDRLEATCPRRTYSAQEHEYTRKKMFFAILALTSALQELRVDLLATLALIVAFASDDEDDGRTGTSEEAMGAFKKLMRLRQGKRDGWLRFCKHLGVSPDAIAAPFLENVEWAMRAAESLAESLDRDPENETESEQIAVREFEALIDGWGAR